MEIEESSEKIQTKCVALQKDMDKLMNVNEVLRN